MSTVAPTPARLGVFLPTMADADGTPGDVPTAYVWVDAFRYELAADVAESLRAAGNEVELVAAVAAAPTITPVGMANLCPGSDHAFHIDENGGALAVTVPGVVERHHAPCFRVPLADGEEVQRRPRDAGQAEQRQALPAVLGSRPFQGG